MAANAIVKREKDREMILSCYIQSLGGRGSFITADWMAGRVPGYLKGSDWLDR